MVIYTKDDAELRIPNAIGNINLTITEGGGDVNLEDYYTKNQVDNKFATKVGLNSVVDNVNELNERISNLEENGGGDVDLSNYYTKEEIDVNFGSEFVSINDNINALNERVTDIENGDINLENYYTKEECIVLANERTEYLEEKINENKEIEVVTVNDLNEVTKEKWIEIANTSNKIYIIEVVDTIMPIKKKKYRVLFTKSDISFKYVYLGAFDENAMYMVTVNNLTVGISKIGLGGGTTDDGNDIVYFDFDIEDGEFNVNDDFNFKTVAQALKENKIVYVNGCLVTSYYIDDNLVGYISIVNNNFTSVYDAMFTNFQQNTILVTSQWFTIPSQDDIDYINDELHNLDVRVSNLEENGTSGGTSDDIEIMTILNYELTQEQVNYICENYSTKNILFKGQYQDEDTFDWLELIRCKIYGKEDDGNWVATIAFSDGVYRYIFNAEKVFDENDELVWQVSKEVEDIYEPTVKKVLINDLATLDGKWREIEVLLDYHNVVNILNGMQTICVLNTRTDIVYSNLIKYIFAIGSDGNNLVKYVWKKQNDNVTFSSQVIGGGGGTSSDEGIPFTQNYLNLIYANEAMNFQQDTDIDNLESEIEKLNKIKRVTYKGSLENFDTFQTVAKDLRDGKEVWMKDDMNNLFPVVGFSPEVWDTERDLCGGWITMLNANNYSYQVKYYDGNYEVDDEGNVINTWVDISEYDLMNPSVDLSNVEPSILTAYNFNDYELDNYSINYLIDKNTPVTIVLDNGNGDVKKLFNASFKISEEKREVYEDNQTERIWREGYLSAFDSATNTVYMWELTKENNYALTDERWDNTYWDEYKTNPKAKIFTINSDVSSEYDVTNGMSYHTFNSIYNNNWQNVILKNGADYAKVTSINTDQKSINSIIYNEYNGELYMYNYHLEGSSNVGTIKYKINMEIV